MPVISQFYGLIIQMFFDENTRHHQKHLHVRYNEYKVIYNFEGEILDGKLSRKQQKLMEAWISIHKEKLESLWNLMREQDEYFKIEPLK